MRRESLRGVALLLLAAALAGRAEPGRADEPVPPAGDARDVIRLELLYRTAQGAFLRGEYRTALPLLQRYVRVSVDFEDKNDLLFGVLDQIAQIQLRELRDPDRALLYFRRLADDPRLSAAQRLAIEGWLASIEEWKELGEMPDGIRDPDRLFALGKRYWERAQPKRGQAVARADLLISMSYLLRFVRENNADPRIPEALYMLGYARSYRTVDPEYWTANHYLQAAIQRAPHTPLAWRAWQRLNEATRARYRNRELPPSIAEMLETYRKLAEAR